MDWTILKEATEIWGNDWIKVLEINVRLPTGVEAEFYALDTPDSVAVLAVDDQRRAILNRQFRPALGKDILELPSGQLEKSETTEKAARRELAEESGLYASDLTYLGNFFHDPGRETGSMHVYFAKIAGKTSPRQEQYECIETIRIPLDDLIAQVITNKIHDVTTIFAVLMLQNRLARGVIEL